MKEEIINATKEKIKEFDVWIDDVVYEKEGKENFLRIVLDSEEFITLDVVVKVTRIINPILDKLDLIDEEYTLDVYAKSKGDDSYE